jgi:hypothetical protein
VVQDGHDDFYVAIRQELFRLLVTPFEAIPMQDGSVGGTHRSSSPVDGSTSSLNKLLRW